MFIRKLIVLAVLFVLSIGANAEQYGVNMGFSKADANATTDYFGPTISHDFTTETRQLAFAFNACEDCKLINYRLHAGYMNADVDYNLFDFKDDGHGYIITNTLGFKVVHKHNVRVWVGASYHYGQVKLKGDVSYKGKADIEGYGPTIGVDLDVPDGTTLSFELEFRDLDVTTNQDIIDKYTLDDIAFSLTVLF
jgi:hypothetical protein